jgi:hypothetical protein
MRAAARVFVGARGLNILRLAGAAEGRSRFYL